MSDYRKVQLLYGVVAVLGGMVGAVLVALLGVSYLQWAILTVYGTAVGVLAVFLTQALNRAESRWADGPARKFAGCRRCPSVLRFDSSSGHWQHISQAVADDYGPHDPLPERPGA